MDKNECKNCCSEIVQVELGQLKHNLKNIRTLINHSNEDYETRLRKLEDWKLVFVAKYTVYSSLALFLGSTLSTIAITFIKN